MQAKTLPATLTSYDFLKAFAILLTVADHAGYYFFPDELWWRVAGRLCVPVWFFLIGYAQSRDLGLRLWAALGVLLLMNIVAGMSIAPLPILATFIIIRLCIDHIAPVMKRGDGAFWAGTIILMLAALPGGLVAEYGTTGFLFALAGWFMRRDAGRSDRAHALLGAGAIAYVMVQQAIFIFPEGQFMAFAAGLIFIIGVLCFFRPAEYPALTTRLPHGVVGMIRILGRKTLEIYVLHLILFKALGLWLEPDRFVLLDWKFFSITGL